MRKYRYIILFALIAALAAIIIISYMISSQHASGAPKAFQLNGRTYAITSYALNATEQEKGLMNATVTNSTFMLFYFSSSGIYPFWMKNTYAQLDIIWIDYNSTSGIGNVTYVVNATPCVEYSSAQNSCRIYVPAHAANYVIETKDGFVRANNISIGTGVRFLYG